MKSKSIEMNVCLTARVRNHMNHKRMDRIIRMRAQEVVQVVHDIAPNHEVDQPVAQPVPNCATDGSFATVLTLICNQFIQIVIKTIEFLVFNQICVQ